MTEMKSDRAVVPQARAPGGAPARARGGAQARAPGGRLLVVDDDPDVRDSLARALRCAGYAVTTAVHGADALDALSHRPVDLIVLDVLMPIVDGFDACR